MTVGAGHLTLPFPSSLYRPRRDEARGRDVKMIHGAQDIIRPPFAPERRMGGTDEASLSKNVGKTAATRRPARSICYTRRKRFVKKNSWKQAERSVCRSASGRAPRSLAGVSSSRTSAHCSADRWRRGSPHQCVCPRAARRRRSIFPSRLLPVPGAEERGSGIEQALMRGHHRQVMHAIHPPGCTSRIHA